MDQLHQLPNFLENGDLLVDTNFFIDSFHNPNNFAEFISTLKKGNVEIVTTSFVKYEFLKSKTIDVVRRKEIFFNELVGVVLPLDSETEKQIVGLIEEYKQYMEGVSLVDLILGAFLKRYGNKLFLLTRDHKDFPTNVFDRMHVFNIDGIRDIKTYGVYCYGCQKTKTKCGFEDNIPF